MPLLVAIILLLIGGIVAEIGVEVKDYRTWLRVVDDVRTLIMTSQEDILIPKLEQIPTTYI